MMKFIKFASLFSAASSVLAQNFNNLDTDTFDDEESNAENSRDYLRFLTNKYRQMAKKEADSEHRVPYEERLNMLRVLSAHAGGCNANSTNGSSVNGTNGSNASSNASSTNNCAQQNATNGTAANVTTVTKAPTTATPVITTKAATEAPKATGTTTAAPTTKAAADAKEVITVSIVFSSAVAGVSLPANATEVSYAADVKKALEDNSAATMALLALNGNVPTGTVKVTLTKQADEAQQTALLRRFLSDSNTFDMAMDWTLIYNVDSLDAAKTVITGASVVAKSIAEDDATKELFITAFNGAFENSNVANPAGAGGLKKESLTVQKEVTFSVTSSKDANLKITDLTALESAIEAASNPTSTKAPVTEAKTDDTKTADTTKAADETSAAFEKKATALVSTVLFALASSALF